MIHRIDQRLRDEAARFHFVFACPACAQFDPEGLRCSLGFPSGPHRDEQLEERDELVFCKTFELW